MLRHISFAKFYWKDGACYGYGTVLDTVVYTSETLMRLVKRPLLHIWCNGLKQGCHETQDWGLAWTLQNRTLRQRRTGNVATTVAVLPAKNLPWQRCDRYKILNSKLETVWLSLILWHLGTFATKQGLWTPNEAFFHWNPELLGLGRQIWQINSGALWVFLAELSAPILV